MRLNFRVVASLLTFGMTLTACGGGGQNALPTTGPGAGCLEQSRSLDASYPLGVLPPYARTVGRQRPNLVHRDLAATGFDGRDRSVQVAPLGKLDGPGESHHANRREPLDLIDLVKPVR